MLWAKQATLLLESIYLIATMPTIARETAQKQSSPLKREFLLVMLGLILGFVILPLLVYFTGTAMLGSYGDGKHGLAGFYGDLWKDLATGQLNSWLLVFGPYVMLRVLWQLLLPGPASEPSAPPPAPAKRRKEPTLG